MYKSVNFLNVCVIACTCECVYAQAVCVASVSVYEQIYVLGIQVGMLVVLE